FFVRMACLKAYIVWAGKDGVPKLYELLKHEDIFTRVAAIEGLAKHEGTHAAEAVAGRLTDGHCRGAASKALREMGPAAEKAVHPYLTNADFGVKVEACRILEAIGTPASLDVLNKATADIQIAPLVRAAIDA